MLRNLAEKVELLIAEVKRIEDESESVYLTLGRLFPALMSETHRSAKNAELSLAGFAPLTDAKSAGSVRAMGAFATESGDYFRGLHARDQAFLARINEGIERLSALESLIGGVRADSEEMEIISLNAMTVAFKSGNAGKAFSVVTDELKRLSSGTIALTEEITARGRSLLECFARLRDSLGELDTFQEAFFGELDRALSTGFAGLETEVLEAVRFFGNLLGEAKALREPVQRIMQGVQLQDILRQSLEHVAISLEEALIAAKSDGASEPEELAYVASIAELSASLLADVVAKLDESATGFERDILSLRSDVEAGEGRRRAFGKASGDRSGGVDSGSFSEGSARYLELKKDVIVSSRRLAEQVKGLDESFKRLAGLLARFQNIVVASRIEVAKNHSLGGVATTVQGMIALTERLERDVSGAMSTTKEFIKVAVAAISEYAKEDVKRLSGRFTDSRTNEGMLETMSRIEADLGRLAEARNQVSAAIEGFVLFTPEFIGLIAQGRSELERLKGLAARLRSARGELETLRSIAGVGLNPETEPIRNERLRAMIERFTIFTHKKTAGEIGRFTVEAGTEAGEITLF